MSNHNHSHKDNKSENNYDLNSISNMVNNLDKNQVQDILSKLNIDNSVLDGVNFETSGNDRGLILLNTIKPYLSRDKRKMLNKIIEIYTATRAMGKNI